MNPSAATTPANLWEVHLRLEPSGTVSVCCKRGGERVTPGVLRLATPAEALRLLEQLLESFRHNHQLFIMARTDESRLAMWQTTSKAAGLYWCAAALTQLWSARQRSEERGRAVRGQAS